MWLDRDAQHFTASSSFKIMVDQRGPRVKALRELEDESWGKLTLDACSWSASMETSNDKDGQTLASAEPLRRIVRSSHPGDCRLPSPAPDSWR
jgi:hypothetical protein